LEILFASPRITALFLVANGFLLYGAELLRRKNIAIQHAHNDERIAKLSWMQGIKIGLAECLALIPGFSRTGSTISGGLLIGLNHEDAARFSFLLATPIIFCASLLELPKLATSSGVPIIGPIFVGSVVAGIAAYFSVSFLTKYFKTKKLTPFAIYCIVLGIAASLLFLAK
jgi:undecaprenyl-diphosphatase